MKGCGLTKRRYQTTSCFVTQKKCFKFNIILKILVIFFNNPKYFVLIFELSKIINGRFENENEVVATNKIN